MPFSNSIYKAYLDLATYGPMESAMYERFTQVGEDNRKSNKSNKTIKILLFLLIIFMIVYLFFS